MFAVSWHARGWIPRNKSQLLPLLAVCLTCVAFSTTHVPKHFWLCRAFPAAGKKPVARQRCRIGSSQSHSQHMGPAKLKVPSSAPEKEPMTPHMLYCAKISFLLSNSLHHHLDKCKEEATQLHAKAISSFLIPLGFAAPQVCAEVSLVSPISTNKHY